VNNKTLKKLLPYIIFVLSMIATVMIFFPFLTYNDTTFTGLEIAFGTTLVNVELFGIDDLASAVLPFNMYAVAAFFAPLIGGLFTIVFKKGQVFSLAMFVVAAAMFFMIDDYVLIEYTLLGSTSTLEVDWGNSPFLFIAAFASIFAAIGEMLHISMTDQ